MLLCHQEEILRSQINNGLVLLLTDLVIGSPKECHCEREFVKVEIGGYLVAFIGEGRD